MWLPSVVSSAAASEPLETEDAVAHVRAEGVGDDDLLAAYILVARSRVEALCGVRMVTQTVVMRCECWEDLEWFPLAPVQSITSIAYVDPDGTTQTVSTEVYEARLYGLSPEIERKPYQYWPLVQPESLITVTAVVGYGAAATVLAQAPALVHAVKIIIGDMYAFREQTQVGSIAGDIPSQATVEALISDFRRYPPA